MHPCRKDTGYVGDLGTARSAPVQNLSDIRLRQVAWPHREVEGVISSRHNSRRQRTGAAIGPTKVPTLIAIYITSGRLGESSSTPFPSRSPPPALPFSGERWHFEGSQVTCFQHLCRPCQ